LRRRSSAVRNDLSSSTICTKPGTFLSYATGSKERRFTAQPQDQLSMNFLGRSLGDAAGQRAAIDHPKNVFGAKPLSHHEPPADNVNAADRPT